MKISSRQKYRTHIFSREGYGLLGIFLLAALLRLFHLGSAPSGFHVDELNAGYVGRYILFHGKDIFGNFLPTFFNKFGDFRPTGIFYLSGLSTFIFGLTEFAVRFPSAIIGALTIFPVYLLASDLSGKKPVGYIAALLLAFTPWHIVLSRATSESVIGFFIVCLGLWFVFCAIDKGSTRLVVYGALCMLAGYFFYHSFRVLVPLLSLALAYIAKRSRVERSVRIMAIAFFAITLVLALTNSGAGRFQQVVFYKNPDLSAVLGASVVVEKRTPLWISRVFFNKPLIYVREFVQQYLSYFSPGYLFLNGGYPDRYRMPDQGLIPIVLFPFLFLGLLWLLREKELTARKLFVVFFLVVAPLPAALTYEDAPNIQRSLPLLFPLIFLAAYGLHMCLAWVQKKKILLYGAGFVLVLLFLFESSMFLHTYFTRAASYKSVDRNEGNKELFMRIKALYPTYDFIVMPLYDELPMYASFYFSEFGSFPSDIYRRSVHEARIGKMMFVDSKCPLTASKAAPAGKGVYISYDGCDGRNGVREQTAIVRSDSTTAYRIYTTD